MHEPIVQECRGLILDEADDWRVIARPYDKFFNLGEPNAVAIDWGTATVCEKVDGSMMTVYRYRGQWHVATSGTPDASGVAHEAGISFAELFQDTWARLGYRWPDESDDTLCYMFELMTPQNRVIVAHQQPRLVLHGVRDIRSMHEQLPEPFADRYGWECARTLPLATAADCIAAASELHPAAAEGFVVRDGKFRRVKVKSPRYVALAHLKEGMSGRRMLEIVRGNESDEFLAYFPEFRVAYEAVRNAFDSLCKEVDADFARLRSIPDQKSFAAAAKQTRCSSPVFAIRAGKCASAREFFATCTMPSLQKALGVDLDTLLSPETGEQ